MSQPKKNFLNFAKASLKDFFEAVFNLFIFFPYFFSVINLFKTLFSPWKNLAAKKTGRGFSLAELSSRLSFNVISGMMGFFLRGTMIGFYFLFEAAYIMTLPFLLIIFLLVLPILYVNYLSQKDESEQKAILGNNFISKHLLQQENLQAVKSWFETYYQSHLHKIQWWKINDLFSYPPLARDWALGYTPTLDDYVEELTSPKYQTKIKTVFDRQEEIEQIERTLAKDEKANVIIVGEEGVGKHAIIDALSKKIYEGRTNSALAYKRVLKLNLEKILTATTDQKQRESLLETLFEEASEAKNTILMIENLDKYIALGSDRIDLSIPIEKYGRTDKLQFIATTSPFFYQKFIFNNEKINRIFNKIEVAEINEQEALRILLELTPAIEERHNLIIPYETLKITIEKSQFYITAIPFPEKAIDLLISACIYTEENSHQAKFPTVLPEAIDTILSEKTHIPTRLTAQMKEKLVNLEKLLTNRVIYQEEAINKLAAATRRSFILLGKRKKPLASFLFLGPTGVGKTETAKALAEIFFGSEKQLIRFDMSLYQSKEDIPKLIGSIDINNPGLLTKAIRDNPYGVLLLDEIEKADHDLINIFLTVLDEGYFTDGFGKKVDCKNLIIIATSNAGSDLMFNQNNTTASVDIIDYLVKQKFFSPEFLNRFDGVVVYKGLTQDVLLKLGKKIIAQVADNIFKLYQIKVIVSEATLTEVIKNNYRPEFGARNLDRAIAQDIEDKIAKMILTNAVGEGGKISL